MSETFQCPNCSAPLDYDGGVDPVIRCPYCSSGVVEAGQKIEAVRQYQEVFKTSLKEAKDAIDQLAEGNPIAISYTSYQPAGVFTASLATGSGLISDGSPYRAASLSISGPQAAKAAARVAGGITIIKIFNCTLTFSDG